MTVADDILRQIQTYGIEAALDRWYGTYRGVVLDTKDPLGLGRILVKVPVVAGDDRLPLWAYPKTAHAGKGVGMFWPPYVGDSACVEFENGDPKFPVYSGGWFGEIKSESEVPTEFQPEKKKEPTVRGFKTKKGQMLMFEEKDGEESVMLVWSNGDKLATVAFDSNGSISMVAPSGRRFQLDEENEQLFYSDAKEGTSVNSFTIDLKDGFKLVSSDSKQAILTMTPDGEFTFMGESVTLNASAIGLEGKSVSIGGTFAMSQMVLGTELVAALNALITQLAALTVTCSSPGSPSSPPLNAGAIAGIAGTLAACLSKGHKVGP